MLFHYCAAYISVGVILLGISVFVIYKNPKSFLNRIFAVYGFSIAWWAIFSVPAILSADNQAGANWCRVFIIGPIFMPSLFLHFTLRFLDLNTKHKCRLLLIISYVISSLFLVSDFNRLFIRTAAAKFSLKSYTVPGFLFHFHVIHSVVIICIGIFLLYRSLQKKDASLYQRKQLFYLFWSSLIGYAGGFPNYFLVYRIEVPFLMPFGTYAVALYGLTVAFIIVRYQLLDISVAITRTLIFSCVYAIVLGVPFWVGFKYIGKGLWIIPVSIMAVLATFGPFIFLYLQHRAENKLREEERRYQQAIANLTKKIAEIRDLDKLLDEEAAFIVKEVKADFCLMYLKSDEYKSFRLKSAHPIEAQSRFPEFIAYNDSFVTALNAHNKPLLSAEAGIHDTILFDFGLVIPCFGKDGLLSIIILGAKPGNQIYNNDDILTFRNLSYATSLAIESCTYWKELEERQRQARVAEMDLFSYSVAHEIDNPMSIIKGNAEYLRRHFFKEFHLNQEQQKDAEEVTGAILEAQARVSGMVKAIEEFGKKTPSEMLPFRLNDALEHYFNLYAPILKNHHIQLIKDVPEELPYVRGHLQELMQVLVIFSQNSIHALKYSSEKRICVKAEVVNPDWIRVSSSDTGYGIEKEKLSAIFSAFVTTKASSEGTGMGGDGRDAAECSWIEII